MSRVLLVCPEPLGRGQPAGIGIRFLEIARILMQDGHVVTVLSPDGGTIKGCESSAATPAAIVRCTSQNDVAVVQGHIANELFAHGRPIPTVVDLYDPFLIENLHYYSERGAEVFSHDHATLVTSLLHGDTFLCASEAQRMFYLGALVAAGRANPASFEGDPRFESLLRIAPFGVHPPRTRSRPDEWQPSILFGAIYDWYDPILAIDAVAIAAESIPGLRLTFTRHPNPDITPQGKLAEAMSYVDAKRLQELVVFEPWVPYGQRGDFFERFSLALLTFRQSVETDLSMRTRIYDSLWSGLPVISSSASGTDDLLMRYGAGVVVSECASRPVAEEIVAIFSDRGRFEQMRRGAAAFVADHQWEDVLRPLRDFCRAPRFDETKEAFAARLVVPEHSASILDRLRRRIGGHR